MQRYRFHCVCVGDGVAVFDQVGRWIETVTGVLPAAEAVARAMMARGPGVDWSGWQVEAYDAKGRSLFKRAFGDVVRDVTRDDRAA